MLLLAAVLATCAAYLTAYVLYEMLLFAANAVIADPPIRQPSRYRTFNVIIPAHNEELYLPRLLTTLAAQDYPKGHYRVTVVADNCDDNTAAVAAGSGAGVLERVDAENVGKGHAIRWALEHGGESRPDAVAIVDADSMVDREFLKYLNLQMDAGDRVIQCNNALANPNQSWFTRLIHVSRTISNEILHPGKRKLGLSSHLMGNGMCFEASVIAAMGWNAFSVGEDWEFYAMLLLAGGEVGYSRKSRVYHQESIDRKSVV